MRWAVTERLVAADPGVGRQWRQMGVQAIAPGTKSSSPGLAFGGQLCHVWDPQQSELQAITLWDLLTFSWGSYARERDPIVRE